MKPIKILILMPWYTPYRTPLLREIHKKAEYDVTTVFSMPREEGREWAVAENLPYKALFLKPFYLWKYRIRKMFDEKLLIRYPRGLIKTIFHIQPDVIIGLEFRIDCMIGCLYCIFRNLPYITWSDMTRYHDQRLGALRIWARKLLLLRSDALIGSCSDTLDHFKDNFHYPDERCFLSILSAHAEEVIQSANIEEKPVPEKEGHLRFLYVGSLIPLKGLDLMIKAFARFHRKYPNSRLTLIGKGKQRSELKALAQETGCEESVVFKGTVPYGKVPEEMMHHDVFVFPTLMDVFGLVIAEAAGTGLPIICSKYAGAANDLVKDNGFIIDPADTDQFAAAMEKMAEDPQMRNRMSVAGKTLLHQNSLPQAVEGYAEALRHAVNRRSSRTDAEGKSHA